MEKITLLAHKTEIAIPFLLHGTYGWGQIYWALSHIVKQIGLVPKATTYTVQQHNTLSHSYITDADYCEPNLDPP